MRIVYNTGLVLVLMFVFAIPLMGFNFISYKDENSANVLGATTVIRSAKTTKVLNSTVIEQFEYEVVLAKENTQQVLYDIVPVAYVKTNNFVVTIPNEYKELGISAKIEKKESSVDLVFETEKPLLKDLKIPATVLILN